MNCLLLLLWLALSLHAADAIPPAIGQNGVVNAASQMAPALAGGPIARGGRITVHGIRLRGAAIFFERDGQRYAAKVLSSADRLIEAVAPEAAAPGHYRVTAVSGGLSSRPFAITIVPDNPGLFSLNDEGWGPARAWAVHGTRRVPITLDQPAAPGERIVLAASGFGRRTAATVTTGIADSKALVSAGVGPGEQEVAFTVPASAARTCFVPVYVHAAPGRASNVVTLAVANPGKRCDPGTLSAFAPRRGGAIMLARTVIRGLEPGDDRVSDDAVVTFTEKPAGPVLQPFFLLPPPGMCTAYTSSFQARTQLPNSLSDFLNSGLPGKPLRAGRQVEMARGSEVRTVAEVPGSGQYQGKVGGNTPRTRALFFDSPGQVRVQSGGGEDLPGFDATVDAPPPFTWINENQFDKIDRRRSLTLAIRDATPGRMHLVLLTNIDDTSTATGACLCVIPAGAPTFTVPAALMANIPASDPAVPSLNNRVAITAVPAALPRIPIAGLERVSALTLYIQARIVGFR